MFVWAGGLCIAVILGITWFGLDRSGFRRSAENAVRAELEQPDLTFRSHALRNTPRFGRVLVCGHIDAPARSFAAEFNEHRRRRDIYERYQRVKGELPARRLVITGSPTPLHPYDAELLRLCETVE